MASSSTIYAVSCMQCRYKRESDNKKLRDEMSREHVLATKHATSLLEFEG